MSNGPKIPSSGHDIKFRSFVVPESASKTPAAGGSETARDSYIQPDCTSGNCHFTPKGPSIPVPDSKELQPILHHLAERSPVIRDNYSYQGRFMDSLAATAWLSIKYSHHLNENIETVQIGDGAFNIGDVRSFLTKKFATLLGSQILHPDKVIYSSVAAMMGMIPSASMLREGEALNLVLNKILSGLREEGESSEKAMLMIKRLSPHLSVGHKMVYEMAHHVCDAIFDAKDAGRFELEVKLLETYVHVSSRFQTGDTAIKTAGDTFKMESQDSCPEIVRMAASDGLSTLSAIFPSLAFTVAPTGTLVK